MNVARDPIRSGVAARLAAFFHRNGYVRRCNLILRVRQGSRVYKKGDEVRLVADSRVELSEIRRLLRAAGFEPGRPFRKGRQFRQPVYGRQVLRRFLSLVRGAA